MGIFHSFLTIKRLNAQWKKNTHLSVTKIIIICSSFHISNRFSSYGLEEAGAIHCPSGSSRPELVRLLSHCHPANNMSHSHDERTTGCQLTRPQRTECLSHAITALLFLHSCLLMGLKETTSNGWQTPGIFNKEWALAATQPDWGGRR